MSGRQDHRQMQGDRSVVRTRVNDCLVITAPPDLGQGRLQELERLTIDALCEQKATAVIFELTGVNYMDVQEFHDLRTVATLVRHLGARTVFVGLRPGIISHLVKSDADISGIQGALGLDDALALFAV
ncbi:STAS domain-containing protein [Rhodobacteraceae bacterium HSP-20]|uniref:STAS domain-containing protein n=1 Tax=Paragemmobacter amnigenus TaxID=2852097 RepID=A0ABS6J1X7_9RHOB|nr:STAS domain-containing protein [Rhodobacter amnigenus]MBU9697537.1 STAS domain-containing protein [Rhodobacter amnigenus]MBV4388764.1 STAS domain-containing protein [Rhodobacter amnigenus]